VVVVGRGGGGRGVVHAHVEAGRAFLLRLGEWWEETEEEEEEGWRWWQKL